MNETIVSVFKDGVVAISEGVKNLAPQVWDIMVRQQIVNGYISLMWAFMWVVLVIIFIIIYKKLGKYTEEKDWDKTDSGFALVVIGILIFVFGIAAIGMSTNAIHYLLNPEYYALMDLKSIVLP